MSARLAWLLALSAAACLGARAEAADLGVELWLDDDPTIQDVVQAASFAADPASDLDGALADPAVLIATATPAHLKALRAAKDKVEAFCTGGGWILLTGLDQEGLADFDALVGVDHILRPFRSERVGLIQDRLTAGISADDLAMRSASNPWAQDVLVADDAYGPVVDTVNLAPFLKLPDFTWFRHPDNNIDHNPFNLVDGFGSNDSWKRVLALYPDRSRLDWPMSFPRPTPIKDIEVVTATCYPGILQMGITLDGGPERLLETPEAGSHHLPVDPPRAVTTIGMRVAKTMQNGRGVVGIDEIRVTASRPAGWEAQVHPLDSIGALVAYPRGSGGVLLCQLAFHPRGQEQDMLNFHRRERILGHLLTNLGARKGVAGRPIAPPRDEARGTPIPLAAATLLPVDQDLLGAKAAIPWPNATSTVAGVRCAMAQPPTALIARDGASATDTVSVEARALILLLAAQCAGAAPGQRIGQLRVTYADGRCDLLPIEAGKDVDDLRAPNPALVERAQLAMCGSGTGLAAFYLRQWDNPTPQSPIAAIELTCAQPHAAIALLSLTALH